MNLKKVLFVTSAALVYSAASFAAEVAPGDVKFEDQAVSESLTGVPGNAEEGANIFKDRKLGNCLACHANTAMEKELFHGTVAPTLDGVADRWDVKVLRGIVTDSKEVFGSETIMPGFYSLNVGADVNKDLVGKTILTAQQVEDVVAYLSTLKQ